MLYGNDETGDYMDLFWNDLSIPTQEAILEFLGENGNYDVIPLTRVYRGSEDKAYA